MLYSRFAAALAAFLLVAPGARSAPAAVAPVPVVAPAAAPAVAAVPAAPPHAALRAAPAAAGGDIVLGQSAPFSGSAAALGTRYNAGAQAYFDLINAAGGMYGRKIRLITSDDRYEPQQARLNTEHFIKQGVFALFGYVGTPTTLAAQPLFDAAGVPLVAAFTGAAVLRTPVDKYLFNVRASYTEEIEQQIQEITASGARRIAVFYQNDAYGQSGLAAARAALARRALAPVAAASVERGSAEVGKALSAIEASRPEAVVMVAASAAAAPLVTGLRAAGQRPLFYSVSFVDAMALKAALGKNGPGVIVTQVVPFPWSRAIPVVKDYQDAMARRGDTSYDFTSLEGFISARVMVEGLRRAGPSLSRAALLGALEGMENVDLGGYIINYSPVSHAGSALVQTTMIGNNGAFIE